MRSHLHRLGAGEDETGARRKQCRRLAPGGFGRDVGGGDLPLTQRHFAGFRIVPEQGRDAVDHVANDKDAWIGECAMAGGIDRGPVRSCGHQPRLPGEVTGLLWRHQDRVVKTERFEIRRHRTPERIDGLDPACGT